MSPTALDKPLLVLKVKFQRDPTPPLVPGQVYLRDDPNTPAFYNDFFANKSAGGLANYWYDVSYKNIDLSTSKITDWLRLKGTVQDFSAEVTRRLSESNQIDRTIIYEWALEAAARNGIDVGQYFHSIFICTATNMGWYGGTRYVVGSPMIIPDQNLGVLAQELAHGLGLAAHSRSLRTRDEDYRNPFDVMSTDGVTQGFTDPDSPQFGKSGPGLNGPNLLHFGWIPEHRIHTVYAYDPVVSPGGRPTSQIEITALNKPFNRTKPLLIKIPTKVAGDYYTVELRAKLDWDRGLKETSVLIHLVRGDGHNYLVSKPGSASIQDDFFRQGDSFVDPENNITIKVIQINADFIRRTYTALVSVTLPT